MNKAAVVVTKAGFVISSEYPFNGTSPDGYVYDPVATEQYGLVEIKCPYKFRNQTPEDAASDKNFYCALVNEQVVLKTNHNYYCQVQGQMAITKRSWCDFVVYTTCGISIERIRFDLDFWSRTMLPRLVDFYDNCLCPAIVSPIHLAGGTQASRIAQRLFATEVGVAFCERKKVGDIVSWGKVRLFVPLAMFPWAQGAYLVYSMLKVVPSKVLKAATG